MKSSKTVAIFGAAGSVGQNLVPLLPGEADVRVVGRSAAKLQQAFGDRAEIVAGDLEDPAFAAQAAAGIDTIVFSVGVAYHEPHRYPRLMRATVAGAEAAGVRRLIVVSTVYPYGRPQCRPVTEEHPREPHTRKGRFRREQEDIALAAVERGLEVVVLRPPDYFGPFAEHSYARDAFAGAIDGRAANLIGPIDVDHEFIYSPDLARTVGAIVLADHFASGAYNVPGTVLTQRALAAKVYAAAGTRLRLRAVGPAAVRALGLFNPLMREIVEMHYLFSDPVVLDGAKLHAALGFTARTPLDESIASTLASMRRGARAA
jgi:nucleoside-diphosphate-sugar epimerase